MKGQRHKDRYEVVSCTYSAQSGESAHTESLLREHKTQSKGQDGVHEEWDEGLICGMVAALVFPG